MTEIKLTQGEMHTSKGILKFDAPTEPGLYMIFLPNNIKLSLVVL